MSEKITIKAVDLKDVCEVKISGAFMQRIQNIYFGYIKRVGVDNVNKIIPLLHDNKLHELEDEELRADAYDIETLLILIKTIESEFNNKDLIVDQEVDIPDSNED